ncbi:MAG TPA: glycosyltransferase family 39 protein [Tepidisphaeraceae bacterium]|jgi:uncharacterized membrane protein|nr:glycosyltransferase family 39 protein [Tepidisphaeraceae bacterium]
MQPTRQKHPYRIIIALLAILGAGFGLRVFNLDAEGLWLDEMFSMEISTGRGYADQSLPRAILMSPPPPALSTLTGAPPWTAIWTTMRQDGHPPLYFLLLRCVRFIFGSSDWTVRFFSVLTSIAAIGIVFFIGKLQFESATALWACLLMAVAVPQLVYAQEARNNPLMVLTGLFSAAALLWIEKRGVTPARLILFGFCLLATMLTHYYCIGALLALFIYGLIAYRGSTRRAIIVTFLAAGCAYLILWGPILLQQRHAMAQWHPFKSANTNPLSITFQRLGVAPMRQLTGIFNGSNVAAIITAIVCVIAFFLLRKTRALLLWWLWSAAVFATLFIHDLSSTEDHLVLPKYALLAGPAIFLLIAAGASRLPFKSERARKVAGHLIPFAAVLFCLSKLPAVYAPYRGNWRDPGIYILQSATPDDVTVFCGVIRPDWSSGWNYLCLMHYINTNTWHCPVILLNQPLQPGPTLDRLRQAAHLFVVIDSQSSPPQNWLPGCQAEQAYDFPHTVSVWKVHLPTAN